MINGSEFEDKATRLFNRLSVITNPPKNIAKTKTEIPKSSFSDLSRLKD